MEIDYAFLADAAQVSEGKLYVLGGGFNRLWARGFPVTHPAMSLVIKISLHAMECDRSHKFEVELWDPDGRRLSQLGGDFFVAIERDRPAKSGLAQLVLNLQNQQFPVSGDYAFHIAVDGHHLKTLPLSLELIRQADSPETGRSN